MPFCTIGVIAIYLYKHKIFQVPKLLTVTFRQLEVFKNIVETGTFSGAASRLNISQPSVSMHIRALEIHLQQPVFLRHHGRAPTLTDVGRRVFDHAEDLLSQSNKVLADIDALTAVKENVLSFAAHRFIGNHLLSKPLATFAQNNTGIEIIANIVSLDQAVEKIRQRGVDLGLFLSDGEMPGITSEVIGHQKLVFIAASDHPLASQKGLFYQSLTGHPFIGPIKSTEYGTLLHSVFDKAGFTETNTTTQSQNTLIRKELILSGVGFSCALKSGWINEFNSGKIVVLDVVDKPLSLEVRVGTLPDRKISKASHLFMHYLEKLKAQGVFDS